MKAICNKGICVFFFVVTDVGNYGKCTESDHSKW